MTDAEKSAMRARLSSAMSMGPSVAPSPSPYMRFFAPRMFAATALALLLIVTTGTAYAAEGSLPGGIFYPVKTGVLEPLTVALAPTTAAKAEANATIATKRVQEAQTLAAKGALTVEAARTISDSYQTHAHAALALAKNADTDAGIVEDEALEDTTVVVASAPTVDAAPATFAMTTGPADPPVSAQPKNVVHLSVSATITPAASTTNTPSLAVSSARTMYAVGNVENQNSGDMATSSNATSTSSVSAKKSLRGKLNASLSTQAKILEELQVKLDTKGSSGERD